jgi:hypothetical protein
MYLNVSFSQMGNPGRIQKAYQKMLTSNFDIPKKIAKRLTIFDKEKDYYPSIKMIPDMYRMDQYSKRNNLIKYLNEYEAIESSVYVQNGIFKRRDETLLDGEYMFAMDSKGLIRAAVDPIHLINKPNLTKRDKIPIYHSSFFSGKAVSMAGSFEIRNGKLISVLNNSGHYQPPPRFLEFFIHKILEAGVNYPFRVQVIVPERLEFEVFSPVNQTTYKDYYPKFFRPLKFLVTRDSWICCSSN